MAKLPPAAQKILPPAANPSTPWHARRADDEYGKTATPDWRGVDWASHLHATTIGGARVNYVDIGEGPETPVVLVHGLGGQWQNWLENIPRLAQERRVVALDLPGHGLSEMPDGKITISGYGETVNELCQQLGLDRVILVGNSMGGFVSAEVAISFPEPVERLVLVSAAGITSADAKRSIGPVILRVGGMLATYTAARTRKIASRPITRHSALALVARHPSKLKADLAYEGLMKGAGKKGFDDALKATLDYDFRDRLTEISCPTLIIWGEKDAVLPAKDADEFERLIPESRKVVLEDTGHVVMAERPDTFNEVVLEFIHSQPVGRATEGSGEGAGTEEEAPAV